MKNVLFEEKQRYNDKFTIVILWIATLGTLLGAITFLIQSEKNYLNGIFFFAIALLLGVLLWWLKKLKLKVAISDKKIKFKMSPIQVKTQVILWNEVATCRVIQTPSAAQWSGANISFMPEKRTSLTGTNGLAIKTKSGEQYFIGCNNIEELNKALEKIQF